MANEFYSGMKGPLAIAKLNELWALNGGVAGTLVYKGNWDASSTVYPLTPNTGHYYRVSVTGVTNTITYTVNDAIVYNGSTWDKIDNTAGGASTTDLGVGTRTDTTIIITSSTGADVTVPQATTTQAGVMSGTDKNKLNGLSNYTLPMAAAGTLGGVKVGTGLAIDGLGVLSATGGAGGTDLAINTRTDTTLLVTSSTGLDATLPQASTTEAGLMSGTDKTKLNSLSNYTHPANHTPSIITQDSSNRFVTDAEKSTWNGKQTALGFTPENTVNKDATGGYAGLTLFKLNLRNAANTITSWFTTAATAARTWTLPDKDGTIAMTSDITGTNSGTNTGDNSANSSSTPISHVGTGGTAHANVVAAGAAGFMTGTDKTRLDGMADSANNYAHPTGDGNLHVPATSTTNNGKVLTAGATAGSLSWTTVAAGGDATTTTAQTFTNKTIEAGTFTNGYTEETVVANTTASYTIDLANGSVQILTLTAATVTYTFPTPVAGKSFTLIQKQDATGSRNVTWPASVKWPSSQSPTLTSTASKVDKFVFTAIDGTSWLGSVAGQNYTA